MVRLSIPVFATLSCALVSGQGAKPAFYPEFHWAAPPGSTFPGREWEKAKSPEAEGFVAAKLGALRAWLKTQDTTGMMVVVKGRVLFEYGDVAQVNKTASVRKSVLGMLMGNPVAEGKINLGSTVKELGLDDIEPFEPIEEQARLIHLMMSRSGIYFADDENGPHKGSQPPDAMFYYNNWDFNAAGTAFEKLTGRNIYDALEKDLALPLGMQDFDRTRQKKIQTIPDRLISKHPEYAMYLSTRDMARLGLLMLRLGKWNDAELMPKNWAHFLTTLHTPASEIWPLAMRQETSMGSCRWGYGLLWWVWDEPQVATSSNGSPFYGSFTAMGTDGQYLSVIPQYDMVVAHMNANIDLKPRRNVSLAQYQIILQMLVDARCQGCN
jgi:CubicO group peptidase (beta-lactamase class C family)